MKPLGKESPKTEAPKDAIELMSGPIFLVVRFSHMDGVDVIDTLEGVIRKRGYCWFGKYGQPISSEKIKKLTRGGELPFHIVFARIANGTRGKNLLAYEYVGAEVSRSMPAQGDYPSYYNEFKHRIKTWLRIEARTTPQIALDDIITISGGQSVKHSLMTSQSGHFFGRLVQRKK